ncbi:hypothetical protein COCSADRAFT_262503 [Bipolaris sorokiniana ND90Pr]|uniref:Uncharacterized protein n=1 Tax=Cochliobolus sativus (strain ND90Pr / ATCC 201652) TaxID=665912 RepID=M2QV18_COCSN|nr:uncharacterized protein COCSADRAFT_262503 [Bipolaris sorokiniana ND90Pr]EMD58989.1 hypothetical protein COCSADRAFT_262503 [Bipolaris sorokiniana ND90Pr]
MQSNSGGMVRTRISLILCSGFVGVKSGDGIVCLDDREGVANGQTVDSGKERFLVVAFLGGFRVLRFHSFTVSGTKYSMERLWLFLFWAKRERRRKGMKMKR